MESKQATPKLRFREFVHYGPWLQQSFSDLYRFAPTNSFSRDQLTYSGGAVKNIHYGDIHTKFRSHFDVRKELVPFVDPVLGFQPTPESLCASGDMVFADASEDVEDVGKCIEVIETDGQAIVAGTHTILAKPKANNLAVGFGGHLFRSPPIRSRIQLESQGAKVLGISPGRLGKIAVEFPKEHSEQRKIAECLTSLDHLITAHTCKLEALQKLKRGLMQNLFPREGETAPRLRFPEFLENADWEQKTLGDLATLQSGGTPSKANSSFWTGSVPWVSAKDMKRLFLEDSEDHISAGAVADGAKVVPAGTPLILTRGMTLLKDVPICVTRREMAFNQDVKALRPKSHVNGTFLALALVANKSNLRRMVDIAGHGTGKLNTDELRLLGVASPDASEQIRIADCLCSLDTLISGHSNKLAALRTHKQSLMQGLFPAALEEEGTVPCP